MIEKGVLISRELLVLSNRNVVGANRLWWCRMKGDDFRELRTSNIARNNLTIYRAEGLLDSSKNDKFPT
jgi:hypothetical protein